MNRHVTGAFHKDKVHPKSPIRAKDLNDIPVRTLNNLVPGTGVVKIRQNDNALLRANPSVVGGSGIDRVPVLPPLPTSGYRAVFWYGNAYGEGGTGDYQEWRAFAGQDRYYPMQKATDHSGFPIGTT